MSDIKQIGHWINGGEVAGTGREQDVFNPATGEVSGRVALASVSDLEQAVDADRGHHGDRGLRLRALRRLDEVHTELAAVEITAAAVEVPA